MSKAARPRTPPDPFWDLVATATRLQAPGGCPWDRAQTIRSLLPHLIEETWEVFDAVHGNRRRHLQEELGDVLYTVLFLTLLAERQGWFTLRTVLTRTRRKMVRRHPHVFGAQTAASPEEAYRSWQASKRRERSRYPSPSDAFRRRLMAEWERLRTQRQRDGGSLASRATRLRHSPHVARRRRAGG